MRDNALVLPHIQNIPQPVGDMLDEVEVLRELHRADLAKIAELEAEIKAHREHCDTLEAIIRAQREELAQTEKMNADLRKSIEEMASAIFERKVSRSQGARIAELAAWLIEERTKELLADDDGKKFLIADVDECPCHCSQCEDDCSLDWCPSKDFWLGIARKQLQAEGKL